MNPGLARRLVSHTAWGIGMVSLWRTGEVGAAMLGAWLASLALSLAGRDLGPLPAAGIVNTLLGLSVTAWAFGYRFLVSGDLIGGIILFLVLIQSLKLAAAKGTRDYLQIHLLGFFQVVAAGTLLTKAVTLPLFILYLLATLWGLLLTAAAPPGRERPLYLTPRLAAVITAGTLLLMGLSLVFFLFLPRVQFGILAWDGLSEEEPIIGFSDTVAIGSFGRLRQDLSRALTLSVPKVPVVPEVPLRIRGLAFTSFDGRTWGNPDLPATRLMNMIDGYALPGGTSIGATVRMEPIGHPLLMLPEGTGRVAIRSGRLLSDTAGNVLLPRIPGKPFSYRVLFDYPPPPEPATGPEDPTTLALPRDYSRIAPLVAEAVGQGQSRREKAARIETWLATRYAYTVDLPPVEGDPVEAFLLQTRRGHCEYFATAMAVMARLAGVPSRVVNGFVAWEYVDLGGFYVVRQRDAHTWVQCLLPEGWVDFDPTPAAGSPTAAAGSDPFWRRWVESVSFGWQRWIYGYRVEDQRELYGEVGRRVERLRTGSGLAGRGWLPKAVAAIAGLGAAVFFLWGGRGLLRRRRGRLPDESRLYAAGLAALARRGWGKGEATAPEEYLGELAAKGAPAETIAPMRELTDLYLEARFAGRPLDGAGEERAKALVGTLRRTSARRGKMATTASGKFPPPPSSSP